MTKKIISLVSLMGFGMMLIPSLSTAGVPVAAEKKKQVQEAVFRPKAQVKAEAVVEKDNQRIQFLGPPIRSDVPPPPVKEGGPAKDGDSTLEVESTAILADNIVPPTRDGGPTKKVTSSKVEVPSRIKYLGPPIKQKK